MASRRINIDIQLGYDTDTDGGGTARGGVPGAGITSAEAPRIDPGVSPPASVQPPSGVPQADDSERTMEPL